MSESQGRDVERIKRQADAEARWAAVPDVEKMAIRERVAAACKAAEPHRPKT